MLRIKTWLIGWGGVFLSLSAATNAEAAALERGPYLQLPASSSIIVRWRTDVATDSVVRYGDAPANLVFTASSAALSTEHEVTISGLSADNRYY